MKYVDHEPGTWFLVEEDGILYLDARYSYSAVIDDSALVRLSDAEITAYRDGGHAYLTDLARRIHHSAPYRDDSKFYSRNLFRGPDGSRLRDAVAAAIAEHAWEAEQRRRDSWARASRRRHVDHWTTTTPPKSSTSTHGIHGPSVAHGSACTIPLSASLLNPAGR